MNQLHAYIKVDTFGPLRVSPAAPPDLLLFRLQGDHWDDGAHEYAEVCAGLSRPDATSLRNHLSALLGDAA